MSQRSHRQAQPSHAVLAQGPSPSSQGAANSDRLAALGEASRGLDEVVVYLTQNSTTHHTDEIPETLAALKQSDEKGLGKKQMIPISDPYSDGHSTYPYAFGGGNAAAMQWWHDDPALEPGQVRMNGDVLKLGANDLAMPEAPGAEPWSPGSWFRRRRDRKRFEAESARVTQELVEIRDDWRVALVGVGLTEATALQVVSALLTTRDGRAKLTESRPGATNELLQLIAVLNRSERGEFDISSLVLSGHHFGGSTRLFGESAPHQYDYEDSLDLRDIEALAPVFPKAYAGVKSVQFSACNSHDLGMQNEDGSAKSTTDWIESVFPNVQQAAYWKGAAPASEYASFFVGEFEYDTAKKENGDPGAFRDARYRNTSRGELVRAERDQGGELSEIPVTENVQSYVYNKNQGMRGSHGEAFHQRPDLMKYVRKGR